MTAKHDSIVKNLTEQVPFAAANKEGALLWE